MIAVLSCLLLSAAFLCVYASVSSLELFIISIGNEAVGQALSKGARSMKSWPWPSACLGCCGSSMHEATVEASACSHEKQSGDRHSLFSKEASHESSALHSAVEEKEFHVAVEHPVRARNLDKADREYKGRQYTKAMQAALGEEVRQKIASKSLRKKQDIGEPDYSNPPQQVYLHEEDCKLDVAAANTDDYRCQNADIGHMKENIVVNSFLSLSTQKDGSWNDVLHRARSSLSADSSLSALSRKTGVSVPESSEMSWGRSYTYKELKDATNHFNDANVLGSGNHAIVYRGVDSNGIHIVLKNLLNNRGQAEKEFKSEVEAIGRVRHKNLVQLIGYCTEGHQRILVYERIDNGNLEQWLHGPLGKSSPLSWDIRMKTIIGTAKGLAYLHEGLEPKVVHRDVKPSNILLDNQWNAKVSDFGFAKIVQTGQHHVATRVMGTFGYVAPEYVSTGMLTEKSDVFSYGVLVMELITGRVPFDRNRPVGEVHLVEWLKSMVRSHRSEDVADPSMGVKPSMRSLKRALLVAFRCVDPDALKRPKMSHVVHMLESADEKSVCQEPKITEVCCGRGTKQLPAFVQRHKVFTIPAFVLPQKTTVMDKSGQEVPIYDWPLHENVGIMGNIDRKATWKRER